MSTLAKASSETYAKPLKLNTSHWQQAQQICLFCLERRERWHRRIASSCKVGLIPKGWSISPKAKFLGFSVAGFRFPSENAFKVNNLLYTEQVPDLRESQLEASGMCCDCARKCPSRRWSCFPPEIWASSQALCLLLGSWQVF